MNFQDPLFAESLTLTSPLLCSGDAGLLGDIGAGTAIADEPQVDAGDVVSDSDTTLGDTEVVDGEVSGEEPPAESEAEESQEPKQEAEAVQAKPSGSEPLPAALSKALRELKQQHPEHAPHLKALNDSYYSNRAFKQVFANPGEASTAKAALEAVGGADGIARMRNDISSIEQFDRMAEEGNPRVIEGLAQQFPDGFKRLVPHALEQLSRVDPSAYREALRGPLLATLEGDGLMQYIGMVMESLKAAQAEPDHATIHYRDANVRLGQIASWYNQLKKEETEFRGRYQDPKLKELEARTAELTQREAKIHENNVRRDITSYLTQTLAPSINQVLTGKNLSTGGRARFETNVKQEIVSILRANPNYNRSLMDLISQGKTDEAVSYAKPFIDEARRKAVPSVYQDLFGSVPAAKTKIQQRQLSDSNNREQKQFSNATPIQMRFKPKEEDVDISKDPKGTLWIQGKAFLKNGKFVSFPPNAPRG